MRIPIRRLAVLSAVLAATASTLVVATAEVASATTRTVQVWTNGLGLKVRSEPSTSASILRVLPDRSYQVIDCYKIGTPVAGQTGVTNIWDHLTAGGYVSDGFLLTGSNQPVVPACGGPTPAPTSREDRAVAWANSMVGSSAYPGLCEKFVENAFNTSGRFGSAIAAYNSLRAAGAIHTTGTPPNGTLVFSQSVYDGGYGHVELSRGDGSYVSGGAGAPSVKIYYTTVPGAGGRYLGWAYAPSTWPGR